MFKIRKPQEVIPDGPVIGYFAEMAVTRVQFVAGAPGMGPARSFKVSGYTDKGSRIAFVPYDLANRDAQAVRDWIVSGGFPEPPDAPQHPRWPGLNERGWTLVGRFAVGAGTVLAGVAAVLTILKRN